MTTSIFPEKSIHKLTTKLIPLDHYDHENLNFPNPEIFTELNIIKSLSVAKFPVYLVRSKLNNQNYAMKMFPYKNDQPQEYFKNEIRFSSVKHSNVIQTLYIGTEKKIMSNRGMTKISYTVMEYAPYGDLYGFLSKYGKETDEIFARTYFKQLIEGLEYLHSNGISHMDIKLDNLLIAKDSQLKITDFDLSHHEHDSKVISKGTKFYRAPELIQGCCSNTKAADIYAAGIILFTLKTRGLLPHSEDNLVEGLNFSELLHNKDPLFWTKHEEIQTKYNNLLGGDFKELFMSMTRPDMGERATLEMVKRSKWYNGPSYSKEEMKSKLEKLFGC